MMFHLKDIGGFRFVFGPLLPRDDVFVSLIAESVFTHIDLLLTTRQSRLVGLAAFLLLQKRLLRG